MPVSTGVVNATPIEGTASNELLTGTAGNDTINGYGGNDTLNGAAGADTLRGGPGNDTFFVENPGDVVVELPGEGTADVVFSTVTWTLGLGDNVELLALRGDQPINGTGNELNNTLWAFENSAANVLRGLTGNDTYFVADGDTVEELSGQGTDTVNAYVNFVLSAEVENLTLVNPSAALVGTGNNLANTIIGNALANTLTALDGNDTITGGLGNDTLDGGAGIDTAVFTGTLAEHTIVRTGDNSYTFTRNGETDSVSFVEFARFDGGVNIGLTTGGVAVSNAAPAQGQALSVLSTLANATSLSSPVYQWQSSADGATGWTTVATGAGFTPSDLQLGQYLRVLASFSDATGNTYQAMSQVTAAVSAPTSSVVVDGLPTEDQVLTANTSAVQGSGPYTYQWLRDGVDIGGAVAPSYTLGDDDVGRLIKVRLNYTDGWRQPGGDDQPGHRAGGQHQRCAGGGAGLEPVSTRHGRQPEHHQPGFAV